MTFKVPNDQIITHYFHVLPIFPHDYKRNYGENFGSGIVGQWDYNCNYNDNLFCTGQRVPMLINILEFTPGVVAVSVLVRP